MSELLLGVDIGTSSSKGVLARPDGLIVGTAERPHELSLPHPGWAEHDAEDVSWHDFVSVSRELVEKADGEIVAVCPSGIGPCMLAADRNGNPLRPTMLYGIDTRATREIEEVTQRFDADEILRRCGSLLSSQAVGPKLAWLRRNEPEIWDRTEKFFMASSFIVHWLSGEYVLDHHSASQCDPFYDLRDYDWIPSWAAEDEPGDLLLMYGTTMFVIEVLRDALPHPGLWGTSGILPGTHNLAAGMATSGALTGWLKKIRGELSYETLTQEAAAVPPGAAALVVLPYFAGERMPLYDPQARGLISGLTLSHGRGHLYRALLEATAYGLRHIFEVMAEAGGGGQRVVASGGGTKGGLWIQIVSDVTGRPQDLPEQTIGAAYGDALLAARAIGLAQQDTDWSKIAATVEPDERNRKIYDELYGVYRDLYPATRDASHCLAHLQHGGTDVTRQRQTETSNDLQPV